MTYIEAELTMGTVTTEMTIKHQLKGILTLIGFFVCSSFTSFSHLDIFGTMQFLNERKKTCVELKVRVSIASYTEMLSGICTESRALAYFLAQSSDSAETLADCGACVPQILC